MHTITFYSYKGGTGRTLAVANTAMFLARCGCQVFVLDFDLEAPGLHYKLGVRQQGALLGLVDFIQSATTKDWIPELGPYFYKVENLTAGFDGSIFLMPAGDAPSPEYSRRLAEIRLPDLFKDSTSEIPPAIPLFLELKERIEKSECKPHYLLIDARTGITEMGGVAVRLMPDTVVCLGHSNPETLEGARNVLRNLRTAFRPAGKGPIEIVAALAQIPEMPLRKERGLLDHVLAYFNESAEIPEQSLSLSEILPLHSDPDLHVVEALRFGRSITANESILFSDYLKLFRKLGLDKHLRTPEEKRVLEQLAESDRNDKLSPLLVGRRRLTGESTQAPIKMRQRLEQRSSPTTFKVVLPAYFPRTTYSHFIEHVRHRLVENLHLTAKMDSLLEKDVRWDLLAVHLREGVVDFCDDLYYLTENRNHLVEIVQLAWCSTFVAYGRTDSVVHEKLRQLQGGSFAESMKDLIESYPTIALGVLGDTPAASETNRKINPLLAASKLITKGNEKDLLQWLEAREHNSGYKIAICDHVVAHRLNDLPNGPGYSSAITFSFEQRVPLGIVCPREDRQWRKELSRAIADSLLEFQVGQHQNGPTAVWRAVSEDFQRNGLDPLRWPDLRTSLLLDMPFEQAVEWDRRVQAASDNTEVRE